MRLRVRHALALARLPSPEAQREVYEAVKTEFEKPAERNYETYVDRWLRKHAPEEKKNGHNESDGWTCADLEEDGELSNALDRIEKVYGAGDRKAIQKGTIGLSRKDIIALAAFHESKMKEVHYLDHGEPLGRGAGDEIHQRAAGWRHDHPRVTEPLPRNSGILLHLLGRRFDISVKASKANLP